MENLTKFTDVYDVERIIKLLKIKTEMYPKSTHIHILGLIFELQKDRSVATIVMWNRVGYEEYLLSYRHHSNDPLTELEILYNCPECDHFKTEFVEGMCMECFEQTCRIQRDDCCICKETMFRKRVCTSKCNHKFHLKCFFQIPYTKLCDCEEGEACDCNMIIKCPLCRGIALNVRPIE